MGKVIMKRKWKLRLSLKATMLVLLQFNKDAGSKKVRYANNKTASMRFVYAHPNHSLHSGLRMPTECYVQLVGIELKK